MAKEWVKFEAEYKKILAQAADLVAGDGAAATKRISLAMANASEGEGNVRDSLVNARKNGVTGNTFADFVKDRGFQEASKLLTIAANDVDAQIKALKQFSDKAATTDAALATLQANIEKDLAKRKDSSESKKDIEALQAKIVAARKRMDSLGKLAAQKVTPRFANYSAEIPKIITKLIQAAPEAEAKQKRAEEAPQKLQDRVINTALHKCAEAHKLVVGACAAAIAKAEKGDKNAVQTELKNAALQVKLITAMADEYAELLVEFKDAVENSKDKVKIRTAVAKMVELRTDAERRARGTATTIKKAG